METILSHHADRPVAPGPRAPPGTRVLPPPGPRSPHPDESDWSWGDGTWAPAQPPAPRRGHGPSGRRTSCARSPARRRTWSPPHAERHRATGRWQGEHGGQQAHSYSPAKHNRSVTTTTARTVTDVLTQNCHRSPEASHPWRAPLGEKKPQPHQGPASSDRWEAAHGRRAHSQCRHRFSLELRGLSTSVKIC